MTDDYRYITPGDVEWPTQLLDIDGVLPQSIPDEMGGTPAGLWVRGDASLADLTARSVSIVGARACTAYGETVATDLAVGLAQRDYTIVSGGAFGIDAAAHRGALAAKGATVAVLACGVDVPYPAAHAALLDRIASSGGLIVSEFEPGSHPTRYRFLARNRLVAALTWGTVLVEAGMRSGSRNTVSWAGAMGRPVLAVPGPMTSVLSALPHKLIVEGKAALVTSPEEVVMGLRP